MTNNATMTPSELAARRERRAIIRAAARAMDETRESERITADHYYVTRDARGYGHAVRS